MSDDKRDFSFCGIFENILKKAIPKAENFGYNDIRKGMLG